MWIVRVALDRPYTFIVLALLILVLSPIMILRTPTDIFPNINIPVIAVAWQFTGMNPEELEGRLTSTYERILTTTVDNIEHIESTTVNWQAKPLWADVGISAQSRSLNVLRCEANLPAVPEYGSLAKVDLADGVHVSRRSGESARATHGAPECYALPAEAPPGGEQWNEASRFLLCCAHCFPSWGHTYETIPRAEGRCAAPDQ
jgi:hypothetical protein